MREWGGRGPGGAASSFRTAERPVRQGISLPGAAGSRPIRIKGVRPPRGVTESDSPAQPPQTETLRAEPHGPHRDPRRPPAPPRRAAAPAPGGRRPARSRGACGHRTALPLLADLAGNSLQEHPEREGDGPGTPLWPNGSHSHSQEWPGSLSQPRSPHG